MFFSELYIDINTYIKQPITYLGGYMLNCIEFYNMERTLGQFGYIYVSRNGDTFAPVIVDEDRLLFENQNGERFIPWAQDEDMLRNADLWQCVYCVDSTIIIKHK